MCLSSLPSQAAHLMLCFPLLMVYLLNQDIKAKVTTVCYLPALAAAEGVCSDHIRGLPAGSLGFYRGNCRGLWETLRYKGLSWTPAPELVCWAVDEQVGGG